MTGIYLLLVQLAFKASTPNIALFLMCAVLPWSWFTAATNDAMKSLQRNRGRLLAFQTNAAIFPLADVMATAVRFLASLPVFLGLAIFYQINLNQSLFWLLPLISLQLMLALGCSWWLAAAQSLAEDTENFWRLATRVWFFLAPSIYSLEQIPTAIGRWLWLNPFTVVFHGYRQIWIHGQMPELGSLWMALVAATVFAVAGYRVIRRSQPYLALQL